MGFALPNLLPRVYTHYASTALFAFFGLKLLKEAVKMDAGANLEELEVGKHLFFYPITCLSCYYVPFSLHSINLFVLVLQADILERRSR